MPAKPPFHRILLATEHTPFDAGAERLAFWLAQRASVPLAGVLPIVSNPEYEATAPDAAARADAEAFAALRDLRAAAAAAGIALDLRARHGSAPHEEILAEACRIGADLVVIRRRGERSFLARLLVGEMVSRVAARAPCSVLLAPRAALPWSRRILAAVDGSVASLRAVSVAAAIAAAGGLPLLVAAVVESDRPAERARAEAILAAAGADAASAGAGAETRVLAGRPAEAIVALAAELGVDLVVIGRRGLGAPQARERIGSTALRTVGLATTAVLVVGG